MATWWAGLLLGVALPTAARIAHGPKREARDLIRPIGLVLLIMPGCGEIAGALGYIAARAGWVVLLPPCVDEIPVSRRVPFLVDLWMHGASCGVW